MGSLVTEKCADKNSNTTDVGSLVTEKCADKNIYEILYVDDWIMFSTSKDEIQEMLNIANEATKMFGQ